MHPAVSVVIPVYNGAPYIGEIVSYLDDQTYRDFEAIMVVDTASDDGSLEIANSISRDYLRVLSLDTDGRISGPRNLGMDDAKGEFVWFLDADDRPLPEFLERMMCIQRDHDADVVVCNFVYAYDKKKDYRKKSHVYTTTVYDSEGAIQARLDERIPVTTWSKIFRLSLLRDNDIRFRKGWCEDIEHTFRAFTVAKTICYTTEPLYLYYQHPGSFTGNRMNMDSRGVAEQLAYRSLDEAGVRKVDGFDKKVAKVRMRSSGHMSYHTFIGYARSDECREMIHRCLMDPFDAEAFWYLVSPTTYYAAIQVFFKLYYYRDGKFYTKMGRPQ